MAYVGAGLNHSEAEEKRKLYTEFRQIDLNGNGYVDKNEMMMFLAQKGIDEDHRGQIVDELFSKCD
jgi:Ca2+-binding EF-hand superfamily protein